MKMRAILKVKTPDSKEFSIVNSVPHDGTIASVADAFEYLTKQRDGWQAAGIFPPGSTWVATL